MSETGWQERWFRAYERLEENMESRYGHIPNDLDVVVIDENGFIRRHWSEIEPAFQLRQRGQ